MCEQRDVKGLYRKARAGLIRGFTGVDDPHEVSERPDVIVHTDKESVEDGVDKILRALSEMGFLEKRQA